MTLDLDELERQHHRDWSRTDALELIAAARERDELKAELKIEEDFTDDLAGLLRASDRKIDALTKERDELEARLDSTMKHGIDNAFKLAEALAHLTTLMDNGGSCCIALGEPCETHRAITAFINSFKDGDAKPLFTKMERASKGGYVGGDE